MMIEMATLLLMSADLNGRACITPRANYRKLYERRFRLLSYDDEADDARKNALAYKCAAAGRRFYFTILFARLANMTFINYAG